MKENDSIDELKNQSQEVTEAKAIAEEENCDVEYKREAIEVLKKYTEEDDEEEMGEISLRSILGGDILQSRFIMKQVLFIMFCVFLSLVYTGNRYSSQQDAIIIDSLRTRLQEVKYNVMTQSSDLMNASRQSNIERRLRTTKDSVLQPPITPPYLIRKDTIE